MQPIKMEEKLKQARFALMTMFEVLEKKLGWHLLITAKPKEN